MADLSFVNNDDFMTVIVTFFALGLFSWFVGFGISFIIRIFIKILGKGV